jgi:hypothetical protein
MRRGNRRQLLTEANFKDKVQIKGLAINAATGAAYTRVL